MFISDFAIKRPVVTSVTMMALVVFGLFALFSLDTDEFPEVEAPFIFISVPYPGASPDIVEREVIEPIEEAVAGISGVDQIQSQALDGFGSIQVIFVYGVDPKQASQDIRDAVSQIRGDLPEGILEPQVVRAEGGSQLAIFAVETSDMTLEQLSWYVDNDVSKKLLSIPGMASVDRYGGVNREIRVILDPAAIQAQGITTAQVNQQLRQINLDSAGGRAGIAGSEQSVRVLGNAKGAAELAQTQIALPGGRAVRL
ncbi:MAG TPA: efflux RND transporter permease subunit, partial [Longimicrobium sp.]|nr:efflux RND transporter permease subunit [Longimicrobium sp.]